MSTKRNYPKEVKPLNFNVIEECYEYNKKTERIYSWKSGEDCDVQVNNKLKDVNIPKDIKWTIEQDYEKGAKLLANHIKKTVVISIEGIRRCDFPKNSIDLDHGSGGYFETINYSRGKPKNIVINPDEEFQTEDKSIKIRLDITPNKNHYIYNSEQHKYRANDYCLPCMLHGTSTVATVGAGKKSSRKTKGRKKREKFMSGKDFSLK